MSSLFGSGSLGSNPPGNTGPSLFGNKGADQGANKDTESKPSGTGSLFNSGGLFDTSKAKSQPVGSLFTGSQQSLFSNASSTGQQQASSSLFSGTKTQQTGLGPDAFNKPKENKDSATQQAAPPSQNEDSKPTTQKSLFGLGNNSNDVPETSKPSGTLFGLGGNTNSEPVSQGKSLFGLTTGTSNTQPTETKSLFGNQPTITQPTSNSQQQPPADSKATKSLFESTSKPQQDGQQAGSQSSTGQINAQPTIGGNKSSLFQNTQANKEESKTQQIPPISDKQTTQTGLFSGSNQSGAISTQPKTDLLGSKTQELPSKTVSQGGMQDAIIGKPQGGFLSGNQGGSLISSQGASQGGSIGGPQGGSQGTSQAKQQPAMPTSNQNAEPMNFDELLRNWKKDLDVHVENYQKISKELIAHENDALNNLQTIEQLSDMISKMEKDYSKIELSLSRITKDQAEVFNKLENVEKDLSKYVVSSSQDDQPQSRGNIVSKAKALNSELDRLDNEISDLVDSINGPDLESAGTFLSQNLLNNYFEALQSIESQAVTLIQ